jgi:hypothetical protein
LQAQRAEVVFRELACLPALELVTELVGALLDERFVEIGVLIHVFSSSVERMPCGWHCTWIVGLNCREALYKNKRLFSASYISE